MRRAAVLRTPRGERRVRLRRWWRRRDSPEGRADPLEIRGTTYDGDDFNSTALRGAPLLINVWYASCPPCRVEAPALKAVHSEYSALGVEFVGVNTRDKAGPAAAFEETFGITYPSISDTDGAVIASMDGSVSPNAAPRL